jgi:sigma-B regulation protein RsbU (phosphoserine phosphatase)
MNAASASLIHELRPKILERRTRLAAAAGSLAPEYFNHLLAEIDEALSRIEDGTFGRCDTCHDPIEPDRLACNPLLRFCLDHLSPEEQKAHEQDLQLATQIQEKLLPKREVRSRNWSIHYRYQPAGVVGGDYCEIISGGEDQPVFFAVGDVTGKGVAASLLMTHLSAIFRSLLSMDLPLGEIMSRANRLFCESTPATHYATLAAVRTYDHGVDLCNAGHCRPLVLRQDGAEWLDSTGLPLGLFCENGCGIRRIPLEAGDTLVLYSDGVSEAQDLQGNSYDELHLLHVLRGTAGASLTAKADAVFGDVTRFRQGGPQHDDMTLLIACRH